MKLFVSLAAFAGLGVSLTHSSQLAPISVSGFREQRFSDHAPLPGDALSPFRILAEDGSPFDWRPGRVTLITFCAYWCDTWKTHLRRVANACEMLRGLPVDFLAVSIDGRWTELGQRQAYHDELRTLKDPGGAWSHRLGIDEVPFTVVVDDGGTVTWSRQGIRRSEEMADVVRRACTPTRNSGTVYLTFDDFPKANGDQILDALRANDAQGTFFCVCSRAGSAAGMLKRAVEDGDSVQIHAWNHDDPNLHLDECEAALKAADGQSPTLLRKPGKESVERLDGRPLNIFVVDPYDFQRPGVHELLRRVLSALRPGCVVQLHAGVTDTLAALPEIIAGIRKQGFSIGVLR